VREVDQATLDPAAAKPFKVPLGLAPDGSVVVARDAAKAITYLCPACSSLLTLRSGEVRRRHFAHRADTGCSPETALHEGTKRRLAAAVTAWRAREGPQPIIRWPCPSCGRPVDSPVSEKITAARVECRTPAGRLLDVGLTDASGALRLGLEVLVSHAVDEGKQEALGELAWIEIEAARVEDPAVWPAKRIAGRVSPVDCGYCAERRQNEHARTIEIVSRYGLPDPGPNYFVVETGCWKCHRVGPVFFWPGVGNFADPPPPAPASIKRRFSRTRQESYLSNGCIYCDALVGDWFLHELFVEVVYERDVVQLGDVFFPGPETDVEAEPQG
jgi:hypothetical protein